MDFIEVESRITMIRVWAGYVDGGIEKGRLVGTME
jgi:hypothetical protein